MKNKYRIIPFLLVLIAFGCQTEDITSPAIDDNAVEIEEVSAQYNFNVEVKNDMLSFATRADFDKALEFLEPLQSEDFAVWEENLNFVSLRASFTPDELDERGIFDPLAATLMNLEYMIEIGNHVFVLYTNETESTFKKALEEWYLDPSKKWLEHYKICDQLESNEILGIQKKLVCTT